MQVSTPNAVVLSVLSVETPGKRTEEEALACSSLLPLVPPPMPILYLCHIGSIHAYAHVHAYAYAHPYAYARLAHAQPAPMLAACACSAPRIG
jgi:hypothetical protein